jgi:hypothetical protein
MLNDYTLRREETLSREMLEAAARGDWRLCLHHAVELGALTNQFRPIKLWDGGPLAVEKQRPPYNLSAYLHALADEAADVLENTTSKWTAKLNLLTLLNQITHPVACEVREALAAGLHERLAQSRSAGDVKLAALVRMQEIVLEARIETASCHMLAARSSGEDYEGEEFDHNDINPFEELENEEE